MIESSQTVTASTTLKYGMVGGGEGAFIGDVHRKAINMDGMADLVCGCFSSDPENTLRTGLGLGLDPARLYKTFEEMAVAEGKQDEPIDFVVIVTPNNTHYPVAKVFLENGINVVCDKPLAVTSAQARELKELAEARGLAFCVTYAYTGYPVAKHAREMIRNGDLGEIRFVNAEYAQDWLSTLLENTDQKQAGWRSDPTQSGASNCVGDIGSHIENMVAFMTGLRIKRLSARLDTMVDGRVLDDNASIMVEYDSGAKGLYWCSQIAVGNDNGLKVRIFGSKASIEWAQENPNYMKISYLDQPSQIISRGRDGLYPGAECFSRVPSGHPEGYFEAFANIYKPFITFLMKQKQGETTLPEDQDFPKAEQGENGVRFIEKCVESSKNNSAWVDLD
ncbi:Gfo/Idh/MocA family protein [Thermodesulfobacteriota bacterium]